MIKNPIRRLMFNDGTEREVLVEVVEMSEDLRWIWHFHVQPLINSHYEHAPTPEPDDLNLKTVRADVGWSWLRIYGLAALHNVSTVAPLVRSGPAYAMSIVVRFDDAQFPVGMLTCVPQFQCSVFGRAKRRGFTWFLSDAPPEVYSGLLDIPPLKGVALALLDCAIQATLDTQETDIDQLLHADPHGGSKLTGFYEQKCHMTRLLKGVPPITSWFRRGHSEQYFYLNDPDARAFSQLLDVARQP